MRILLFGWLGLLLTLCMSVATYDWLCFQPVLARTRALVNQHPESDRYPPLLFAQLLAFTTHGDTVPYATRVLMTSGDPEDSAKPVWAWQARYAIWTWLYALHASEPERVATIASLGFRAEPEPGLTAVAQRHFGKVPEQLPREQVAMLAELLVLAPSYPSERLLADHAAHLLDTFDQHPHRRPGESRGPAPWP